MQGSLSKASVERDLGPLAEKNRTLLDICRMDRPTVVVFVQTTWGDRVWTTSSTIFASGGSAKYINMMQCTGFQQAASVNAEAFTISKRARCDTR